MGDMGIAITLSIVFSVLIGVIEAKYRSKASFSACYSGALVLYVLFLIVGNSATTLLAGSVAGGYVVGQVSEGSVTGETQPGDPQTAGESEATSDAGAGGVPFPLVGFAWFWYAFLGVFGFEALLQNINLTIFNNGVLSINDWINKARDNAVATAIQRQTDAECRQSAALAERLSKLPEDKLKAHFLQTLGKQRLDELEGTANSTGADLLLTLALTLAYETYDTANAISV